MTDAALQQAHNYSDADALYGQQISSGYSQSNSYYPSIYEQEALRSDNNGNRVTSGIGMSEQTSLIAPTDNNATNGRLQGTSLRPTQTYWYGDNSFMQGAFETASNGTNYYSLLMPDGSNTCYWVASRCVEANSDNCYFRVSNVIGGQMNADSVFRSNGSNIISGYFGLFPVVSLSSELISGNASSGFVVE